MNNIVEIICLVIFLFAFQPVLYVILKDSVKQEHEKWVFIISFIPVLPYIIIIIRCIASIFKDLIDEAKNVFSK